MLKRYNALWLGMFAVMSTLTSFYTWGYEFTTHVLNVIILGVAVTVSMSWTPAALRAIQDGANGGANKVILAIWLSWTALIIQRIYAFALTVMGRPNWLVESVCGPLVITCLIVAGSYAAYSTVSESEVPQVERQWVLLSTLAGGICMGVLGTIFYFTGWRF